jgi:hypothetical protein
MRYSKWIGIFAGILIVVSGFLPWGRVPVSGIIELTGFGSEAFSKFGKPVLFNLYLLPVLYLFFLLPRTWAKKLNPLVAAIGLAWAIRNVLLFSTCRGGFCPETDYGLYVYFASCLLLLLMTFFSAVPAKKG